MTSSEIREFKVELLDDIHELAQEPIADLDAVKAKVEKFFAELEKQNGKES